MSEEKKLIPELRFPEFDGDGEWVEDKFGKVYRFLVTNSFSRALLNFEDGEVKNIHYGDIHTKFSTLFDISQEDVPYINPDVSIERIREECYCQEGDMIFADASEDLNDIGKSIEIVNLNGELLVSGLHTLMARQIKKTLEIGFGGYLFKSDWIRKQIQREAQGAKVLGISSGRISNIKIFFPRNSQEQQKIASCLSSLDELIAAHTDKLNALKDHKKGLMQNLFPQEGETVPKVRFPEFEGDGKWVEKKLGDVADFINGRAFKKEELLTSGKFRVLRVGNFFTNNEWYYSDLELDEDKYCDEGDLLYAWSASFGPQIWKEEKVIYHYHIWKVVEKKEIDKNFLYVLLDFETENIKTVQSRGLGMMHLTKSGIESWQSTLPKTKKEQQKIAACLSAVDDLITAQQEKIDQLQQHKKGLMQGLFPNPSAISN